MAPTRLTTVESIQPDPSPTQPMEIIPKTMSKLSVYHLNRAELSVGDHVRITCSRTTAQDTYYVSISRERHEVVVFTDDADKLPEAGGSVGLQEPGT